MYNSVKLIHKHCENYLNYVEGIGNECAYTDRIVEAIYEEAEVLHKKHDEYFASIDIDAIMEELRERERPFIEKVNAEIEKMKQASKYKSSDEGKN